VSADFLHDALDGALDVLNASPEGTYTVLAADDGNEGRIIPAERPYASKAAAAARQTRLCNEGYRAYLALRSGGTDYLMGHFDGATIIYLSRPAREAVAA